MRNFLLNHLPYSGSNQIMIYIDCNRIKGSLDQESFKITHKRRFNITILKFLVMHPVQDNLGEFKPFLIPSNYLLTTHLDTWVI